MEVPNKPELDKRLFWDIRFEELDYEKYAHFGIMPAAGIERIAR
jgi:hypothetical protein